MGSQKIREVVFVLFSRSLPSWENVEEAVMLFFVLYYLLHILFIIFLFVNFIAKIF